eukprot:scaffold1137_cov247-Chaetoceros_neogracile.AAC.1
MIIILNQDFSLFSVDNRRATSDERIAKYDTREATSNKQQATSNKQQATVQQSTPITLISCVVSIKHRMASIGSKAVVAISNAARNLG